MWIEMLKNGKVRYVERYTDPITGKYKKVSVAMDSDTKKNKKLAFEILLEKIKTKTSFSFDSNITLEKLIEIYLAHQSQTVKLSTYKRNSFAMRSILSMLGNDVQVSRLNAKYIKSKFLSSGKPASTLNGFRSRLLALLRWGYNNEYIEDISYLSKFSRFHEVVTKKQRIEDKFLEHHEVTLLLEDLKNRSIIFYFLAYFMLLSGLRSGEAIALEKSDIDLDSMLISITKTYDATNKIVSTTKTHTSTREIPISNELKSLIDEIELYRLGCSAAANREIKSPLFFHDKRGHYLNYYSFNKILKTSSLHLFGRPLTPHALRHTYTSLLYSENVPLDTVSRFLGHTNSNITKEIYLHITEKQKKKDREMIQSLHLFSQ